MPKFEKPATARPKSARAAGPKAGSKSPNHRGYRPDAEGTAAPKRRWTQDDRAARGATAGDRRPDWSPTSGYDRKRPAGAGTERPAYNRGERTERPARDAGGVPASRASVRWSPLPPRR